MSNQVIVASHSTFHRLPRYRLQTLVVDPQHSLDSNHHRLYHTQELLVIKKALTSQAESHLTEVKNITQKLQEDPNFPLKIAPLLESAPQQLTFVHFPHQTLTQLIELSLLQKQFSDVFRYFDVFLCTLQKLPHSPISPYKTPAFVNFFDPDSVFKNQLTFPAVSPGLLDLTFSNLLLPPDHTPIVIDQEWQIKTPLPEDFLIFRSLYDLCHRLQPLIQLHASPQFPLVELTTGFYIPHDWIKFFHLDGAHFPLFLFWETNWQNKIKLQPTPVPTCLISSTSPPLITTSPSSTLGSENRRLKTEIQTLTKLLDQAQNQLPSSRSPLTKLNKFSYLFRRFCRRPGYFMALFAQREKHRFRDLGLRLYLRRFANYPRRYLFMHQASQILATPTTDLAVSNSSARHKPLTEKSDQSTLNLLIVNGAAGTVSQIHRVVHLADKLKILGHQLTIIPHHLLSQFNPQNTDQYDVLFIHRAVDEPLLRKLIEVARHLELPVVYDIDDLVFDPQILPQFAVTQQLSPTAAQISLETAHHYRDLMEIADYLTCPTDYLAAYIRKNLGRDQVVVLPNHLDQISFDQGQALAQRHLDRPRSSANQLFTLGYFPGTRTHDQDFQVCAPALAQFLSDFPQARLKIVGDLELPPEIRVFENTSQLVHHPKVPYAALIDQYRDISLNLVPLEENAFCQAKSELKYFFAGICAIPTLASPTQPYTEALSHGGGAICDSSAEWLTQMKKFLQNPEHAHACATAAFNHTQATYSPQHQAQILQQFLDQIRITK